MANIMRILCQVSLLRILISFMIFSGTNLAIASTESTQAPNVVLILADDLGFTDLGSYGSEIKAPNLDKLAQEGVRFTNYHTTASCAPSRGMLLTGVDSHLNGVPAIPESIPPSLTKQSENYTGALNRNVVTVATLLKDAGYHTYMAGKWHLGGKKRELLPSRRGFERTVTFDATGADNYEKKTYLPVLESPRWFADGEEIELPEDFYSSRYYVDKIIEFIESNRGDGKPFFSYLALQAVHIPVQVPQEYTDKYMGIYDQGWTAIRQSRLKAAQALKIVPSNIDMVTMSTTLDWDSLAPEEQRYESKRMAVYAGMIDAMDDNIGRFMQYLKDTGEYENTVFIFTSDNGSEAGDPFAGVGGKYFKWWLKDQNYRTDYETLGTRGSFNRIGPSFASTSASPLAYYKWYAGEGGVRVPLIISGGSVSRESSLRGGISDAFAYLTDIVPTILEITGIKHPGRNYRGRKIEPLTGKSLLPLTLGQTNKIHREDEPIGYELLGNKALYKGDYKIVINRGPVGDNSWHLYNIVEDPGETKDLRVDLPELFAHMKADYYSYAANNGVLPIPEGYNQVRQTLINGIHNLFSTTQIVIFLAAVVAIIGFFTWILLFYINRNR